MSCVADVKAMIAKRASEVGTNASDDSESARRPKAAPPRSCVPTTQCFFVPKASMKPLQRGFMDHGQATREVKAAISVSERPRLLYMSTETMTVATKGSPS